MVVSTVKAGRVKFYDIRKGIGKIEQASGRDVFVHISVVEGDGFKCLVKGEPVEFEAEAQADRGGELRAIWVRAPRTRLKGTVREFDRTKGVGSIDQDEQDGIAYPPVWFHYKQILVEDGVRAGAEPGDRVEFDIKVDEMRGPSAIDIKRLDPRPPFFRFASVGSPDNFEKALKFLAGTPDHAGMAQKEKWNYRKQSFLSDDEHRSEYPILKSYLIHTFARVQEEDKIAYGERDGKKYACFNTGLVTPNQEEIFALFTENDRVAQDGCEWYLIGFRVASDHDLLEAFRTLPELAEYFTDATELLYDRQRTLIIDIEHVINENADRLPLKLREDKHLARQLLDSARKSAQARVKRNYKTAIPQYHRGQIQLLLPLCLLQANEADVALVVSPAGQGHYRGHTILTLDQAYNNARLITRPDDEWLNP